MLTCEVSCAQQLKDRREASGSTPALGRLRDGIFAGLSPAFVNPALCKSYHMLPDMDDNPALIRPVWLVIIGCICELTFGA